MLQNKVRGKSLTFKLMVRAAGAPVETAKFMGHGLCDNLTKTINLTEYTNSLEIIKKEVLELVKNMNVKPEDMRGISIQMSKLQNSDGTMDSNIIDGGIKKFMTNKSEDAISKNEEKKICDQNQKSNQSKNSIFIKSPVKQNVTNVKNTVLNKLKIVESKTIKRRGRPPKHALIENSIQPNKPIPKSNQLKKFFNSDKNNFNVNGENNIEMDFTVSQINVE